MSTTDFLFQNKIWNAQQTRFYNSRPHRRMWYDPDSLFVRNVLEKFIRFTALDKNSRILEIGCGAGRYTIPLIQAGYPITAIDISRGMIEQLRKDIADLNLPSGGYDIREADIDFFEEERPGSFDAVIGFNVLHHLFDVSSSLAPVTKNSRDRKSTRLNSSHRL